MHFRSHFLGARPRALAARGIAAAIDLFVSDALQTACFLSADVQFQLQQLANYRS
jgi:hypothetical protein